MGFRPFARLFLDRTFESFVETTNSAFSEKKRSQSQKIPHKDFPLLTSGRCLGLWNAQLAEMQQRVGRQRLQIKQKHAQLEEVLETQKRVQELRGVVLKRKSHLIALQHRYIRSGRTPHSTPDPLPFSPDPLLRLPESPAQVIKRKRSGTPQRHT